MQAWASAADVEGGVSTAASLEAGTGYPSTASLQTTAAVLERYSIMLEKQKDRLRVGNRQVVPVEDGWLGRQSCGLLIAEHVLGVPDEACCCQGWHGGCCCCATLDPGHQGHKRACDETVNGHSSVDGSVDGSAGVHVDASLSAEGKVEGSRR